MKHKIDKYCKSRLLVKIERSKIDPNTKSGIILAYSNDLILVKYVYDFVVDGYQVVDIKDITSIKYGISDRYRNKIMKSDGDLKGIKKPTDIVLSDWHTTLESLQTKYPILIVEHEGPPKERFFIGKVVEFKNKHFTFRHFDATGKWLKNNKTMQYSDITTIQFDNIYINKFKRHIALS